MHTCNFLWSIPYMSLSTIDEHDIMQIDSSQTVLSSYTHLILFVL